MVLVLERGDLLGIFGDLQSSFFFLSERTPHQSSDWYERMFHRGTLPGNKKKDSCLKSLTFLLRLSFQGKFCYLLNKKSLSGISYFVIYFGKLLKAYPLNCSGTDTLNASKLSWFHTGEVECLTFHMHTRYTRTYTHTHSHNHKQPANWIRQLNIWHPRTRIASYSAAWGAKNEQLALSCSPITLILMFKQIQSICR